jgi:hypothetical protein
LEPLQERACAVHDALGRLRHLALPALVIAGGEERLMPAHHAEAGAGHLVRLEAADAFSREVMRLLAAGGPK